jgi:hypothetical protein
VCVNVYMLACLKLICMQPRSALRLDVWMHAYDVCINECRRTGLETACAYEYITDFEEWKLRTRHGYKTRQHA